MAEKRVTRGKNPAQESAATAAPPSPRRRQITCAFCEGEGTDPFGQLSPLSTCQVCNGRGKVWVLGPTIECGFCAGSGVVAPDKRLTCTVCGGKGVVPKPKNAKTCPVCLGSGMSTNTPGLSCLVCKGKGVVAG